MTYTYSRNGFNHTDNRDSVPPHNETTAFDVVRPDAQNLFQYCDAEQMMLDQLVSNPQNSGTWLRCMARLNDLKCAIHLVIQEEVLVENRTRRWQEKRAEELDAEINRMQFTAEHLRADLNSVRRDTFKILGTAGIVPPPTGLVLDSIEVLVERQVAEITPQTIAGAEHIHAAENPDAAEEKTKRRWIGIREFLGMVALGGIQAIVFVHGLGLLRISQIIHLSKPEWVVTFWVTCTCLTSFMALLVRYAFQQIAWAFPGPVEKAGRLRFSPGWIAVCLLAGAFVVEIAFVTTKTFTVIEIQKTAVRHQANLGGGNTDGANQDAPPSLPVAVAFGLSLTSVFFLYKAASAIHELEGHRRHAYLAAQLANKRHEQKQKLLVSLSPLLLDERETLAELDAILSPLSALLEERRAIYEIIPARFTDQYAARQVEMNKARQNYESARETLFQMMSPPSLGERMSKGMFKSAFKLSTWWGAIGDWFRRYRPN